MINLFKSRHSGMDCRSANSGMSLVEAGALHDNVELVRFVAENVGISPEEWQSSRDRAEQYESHAVLDFLDSTSAEAMLLEHETKATPSGKGAPKMGL